MDTGIHTDSQSQPPEAMVPLCSVFRRFLRSRKLKYTAERADVLQAIIDHDDLFEAEELLLEMRSRGHRVSKATIYRTLRLLQEAGIITQALFESKQAHFQLLYGREPRNTMLCLRTGKAVDFQSSELSELRNKICEELGWDPIGHRFQIYAISPENTTAENSEEEHTD